MKLKYYLRSLWEEVKFKLRVMAAAAPWNGDITPVGRLYATKVSNGKRESLGLVSTKVVTDVFVAYLATALTGTGAVNLFRFHGSGTSVAAETAAQTTLLAEVATRISGTQVIGASANIYRSVGTITYGATFAITEHGIFSDLTVGTLADRSMFAAINVINGDSIEFTYELTLPSGS